MARRRRPESSEAVLRAEASAWVEVVKDRLRSVLEERGLSNREVARHLGRGPAYLTNLLHGVRGRAPSALRLDTLYSVLRLAGVSLEDFLSAIERSKGRGGAQRRTAAERRSSGRRTPRPEKHLPLEPALAEPRSLTRRKVSLEVQAALRQAQEEARRKRSGVLKRQPRRT